MLVDKDRISRILEKDRTWSAYALCDLTPGFVEDTAWYLHESSLLMTYSGIQPAVLFSMGQPDHLELLLSLIPAGSYQYSIALDHMKPMQSFMQINSVLPMLRMVLDPETYPSEHAANAVQLTHADLDDIRSLFSDRTDQPDAFTPEQLDQGTFYGVHQHGQLLSLAGTHVLSSSAGIAAVGNVFTHPDYRGQGLATRATGAVTAHLLAMGISTIILNVSEANPAAIHAYRKLGYRSTCSYYEGTGTIS